MAQSTTILFAGIFLCACAVQGTHQHCRSIRFNVDGFMDKLMSPKGRSLHRRRYENNADIPVEAKDIIERLWMNNTDAINLRNTSGRGAVIAVELYNLIRWFDAAKRALSTEGAISCNRYTDGSHSGKQVQDNRDPMFLQPSCFADLRWTAEVLLQTIVSEDNGKKLTEGQVMEAVKCNFRSFVKSRTRLSRKMTCTLFEDTIAHHVRQWFYNYRDRSN